MGELTPPPPNLRPAVPSHRVASFCLESPPSPTPCITQKYLDLFRPQMLLTILTGKPVGSRFR